MLFPTLNMHPIDAWREFIVPALTNPKWIEDGSKISTEIELSKRELLGLILYSYYLDQTGNSNVCWNSKDHEPNDGYVDIGTNQKVRCEHKLIAQMDKRNVVVALKETFSKYAKWGKRYGENRHLIIHANLASLGLAKISDLHHMIKNNCPFDMVFSVGINGIENKIIRFSFVEQFPKLRLSHIRIEILSGNLVSLDKPGK